MKIHNKRQLDDSRISISANFGEKYTPTPLTRVLRLGPKLSKVVIGQWLHLFRAVSEDKMLDRNHKKKWKYSNEEEKYLFNIIFQVQHSV